MDSTLGPIRSVAVFGGVTVDRISISTARPVMGASNPGTSRRIPGGVSLNLAMILARLGVPVRLAARIGDDADGEAILTVARAAGIDTSTIGVSASAPTASYHATFDNEGGLVIGIADMGIYDEFGAAAVAPLAAASGDADLWVLDANLAPETLDYLFEEAKSLKKPVAALCVSPGKVVRFISRLDHIALLFAQRREAATLLGLDPEEKKPATATLAADLVKRGVGSAIVTNSSEPLVAASGSETRAFAPLRAAVRRVNGAGDSLAAGTIFGLSQGRGLGEAIRSGLAAAAITIESDGIVGATYTPELLAERTGNPAKRAHEGAGPAHEV